MAIMARDGTVPKLCFQALVYPSVDMGGTYPAQDRTRSDLLLTTAGMVWFVDHYVNTPAEGKDWRASPLRAADLSGTAPALVLTAYHDPLYDEGEAYARRLAAEGVRVTSIHFNDQIHGFLTMGKFVPAADMAIEMVALALKTAWAG
jgi:acetyl esterase